MADITLAPAWATHARVGRPVLIDRLAHRAEVLRRRTRRDRYLALAGRLPRRYPWFETMFGSMSGR